VDRSVAQGRGIDPGHHLDAEGRPAAGNGVLATAGWLSLSIGLGLAIIALAIYLATRVDRFYDHFVWQAAAFLEGQAAIRYPVLAGPDGHGNYFFQDVLPVISPDGESRALIPFPPLPAILLLPFVAIAGLRTDDQTIFTALAAIDVALCWWMLGRLRVGTVARFATTVFFAFGTVFWYAAQNTTTWYQAHIVAVALLLVAIGLAVGADEHQRAGSARHGLLSIDPPPFVAGLLLGLATTARLTVLLGFPFFVFVGAGTDWRRRAWSAAVGAAIPVGLLLAYNVVSTGQIFHPAYDHLYQLEARAYSGLGYHAEWDAEDPRYVLQNLGIMLLAAPEIVPDRLRDSLGTMDRPLCTAPGATRGLFDVGCPLAVPRDIGMSVLLTSPAYLLAFASIGLERRRRIVAGAVVSIVLISIVNLMHFSQGWVQFGYRFSNDVVPFALILVALGIVRLARPTWSSEDPKALARRPWGMPLAIALITASIAINLWGVIWSRLLGW
jgi:Glycosyltransferase family 87